MASLLQELPRANALRKALGIEEGDHVVFRVEEHRAILARTSNLLELAGAVVVPAPKQGTPWSEVRQETRRSRARFPSVTAFCDTNVLVRHLTGEPPHLAERATAFLTSADELLLPDLIAAEVVYVLESFYEVPPEDVARLVRAIIAFEPIRTTHARLLLRALEVYELERIDFAEAYLVASAEASGVLDIASFDQAVDRVSTVRRIQP